MILERILAGGAEGRLLPAEKLHTPTVAVMGIMTFAMMIVASAGLALAGAASLFASGAESRYVVEIPAGSADLPAAVRAIRSAPGVRSAKAVSEADMRETLEQWLGSAARSADLPVPQLVTVELADRASVQGLKATVGRAAPQATVVEEAAEAEPLLTSIRSLGWLSLALVFLMGAATAAAVVLAARGALNTHRPTVEIMHGIGATDEQVTKLFQRKIALDAIAGAIAGTAAAGAVLLVVGGGLLASTGDFTGSAGFGPGDLVLLALVPLAAVLLAVAVARRTLLGALRASL